MKFDLKCPKDWEAFTVYLAEKVDESKHYTVEVKKVQDTRTAQQRKSIELYCRLMSEALNDGGIDYVKFLETIKQYGYETPWSQEKVKDQWRLLQSTLFNKESTTELTTNEVTQVYDLMNREFIRLAHGISIEFPNRWHGLTYE